MVAVYRLIALGLCYELISGWSGAILLQQRTAQQKPVTYGYAKEYVVFIAGHIRRSEKARIYGKGAEMYKSIYKKGTQRR